MEVQGERIPDHLNSAMHCDTGLTLRFWRLRFCGRRNRISEVGHGVFAYEARVAAWFAPTGSCAALACPKCSGGASGNVRLSAIPSLACLISAGMRSGANLGCVRPGWKSLRPGDQEAVADAWDAVINAEESEREVLAAQIRPPRVAHAIVASLDLEQRNSELRRHLRPFVIRHQHPRGYREHFVGVDRQPRKPDFFLVAWNGSPG